MNVRRNENLVFFLGCRSFRSRGVFLRIVAAAAISALAFAVAAAGLVLRLPFAGYLAAVALVAGVAALLVAANLFTSLAIARVDRLTISRRGVKYGDSFWGWESVRAIRARRAGRGGAIRLLLWTGEDKGPGRVLAVDERISADRAVRLIGQVGEFCLANDLKVRCEASC